MYKNVASQKLTVFAVDSTGAAKTGDAANITAYYKLDGGSVTVTSDANPSELDATNMPGMYEFDLSQAETNGDLFRLYAKSATSGVKIDPVVVYTVPATVDANVTKWLGTAAATPTTNGIPKVETVTIEGQSLSNKVGDNFNTFFQNGGVTSTSTLDLVKSAGIGGDGI